MLKRIVRFLTLPAEVTRQERAHLAATSRVALWFFAGHVIPIMGVAALAGTGVIKAGLLTLLTLLGPLAATRALENPRHVTRVFGVAAMCMGALLVHFGQGSMQIEMHFYFFVLLALLSVFGDPLVIVIAAVTVALHHAVLFAVLPRSVFNYDASFWAVVVHALFVVLESVGACYVARSFFDRVIGLERIVAARTRDLRLLLDSVDQGLLTFGLDGVVAPERSAVLDRWFGPGAEGEQIGAYLARADASAARGFEAAWQQVLDDALPMELCVDQMPKRMTVRALELELEFKPLLVEGALASMMLVISDATARHERERSEEENRDVLRACERIVQDRAGFLDFVTEADALVRSLAQGDVLGVDARRGLHTLKGNCGLFGLDGVARLCHSLEDAIDEGDGVTRGVDRLVARWRSLHAKFQRLFGAGRDAGRIEVTEAELARITRALSDGATRGAVQRSLEELRLDPVEARLACLADQARELADKLGKGSVQVSYEANGLRLPRAQWAPIWSALVHAVHNALDHGVESPEERALAGKHPVAHLSLRAAREADSVVIEVSDDGRGVDWERVRARAVERGLPAETRDDLVAALFEDGLSTKASASEVSGRGVGMGALRAACEQLGGALRVECAPGRGTRVEVRVPTSASMKPPDSGRRAARTRGESVAS